MILLNKSALKMLKSLSASDLNVKCAVDCGTGSISIADTLYELTPVLGPKVDEQQIDGYVCRKFGDTVAYYSRCNKLIGDERTARGLANLGITEPEIATEILDDKSYMPHQVCSVGYSNVLGKWCSWDAIDLITHDSRESAADYSCRNCNMDMDTTKLIETVAQPAFKNATPANVLTEDHGLKEIYGGLFESMFAKPLFEPCDTVAEASITNDTSGADSAGINGSTIFPSIGIRSGEHRQHNISGRNARRLDKPQYQSGEQRQHNVPYINNNPSYTAPMVEVSASASNPEYSWFRYAGDAVVFDDHNRSYDLTINEGDVFGVRKGRAGAYFVVDKDAVKTLFNLSEAEVRSVLVKSKPYKGSVGGVRVSAPSKEIMELTKVEIVEGVKSSTADMSGVQNFAAFYLPSAFKREYSVVFGRTKQETLEAVEDALKRQPGVPVAYPFNTTKVSVDLQKALAEYRGKSRVEIAPAIAVRWIEFNKIKAVSFTSDYSKYSVKPRDHLTGFRNVLKAEKKFSFVPIFKGNESEILLELKNAIQSGYYTREFKPCHIEGDTIQEIKDTDLKRLYLVSDIVTPLFEKEAENIGRRIAREYGPFIVTKVHKKFLDGKNRLIVVVSAQLPKASDETAKRSAKIYALTKYLYDKKSSPLAVSDRLNKLEALQNTFNLLSSDMEDKQTGVKMAELDLKIKNIVKELDETAKVRLILDAPIYVVKIGDAWVTVTVLDVNYAQGSVVVRQVRGGNRKPFNTTQLFSFSTHKQVI